MRLNTTSLSLVNTFMLIDDVKCLNAIVDSNFMRALPRRKREREAGLDCDQYLGEVMQFEAFRERAYSSSIRYGLILLLYSIIETELDRFRVRFLSSHGKKIQLPNGKSSDNSKLAKMKRSFGQVKLSPPPEWKYFDLLDVKYRDVRNVIAHEYGICKEQGKLFEMEGLSIADDGAITIKSEFVAEMARTARLFFEELFYDHGFRVNGRTKKTKI